jgi:hypothetical protein
MFAFTLAALKWDPQIRGFGIIVLAALILVGSVYMLLTTNTGAKLAFAITAAALAGWMGVLGVIWMVFGIGLQGRVPTWKPREIVTGSLSRSTIEATKGFDKPHSGWTKLKAGSPAIGDVQANADKVLAPVSSTTETKAPTGPEGESFVAPFKATTEYVQYDGYEKGKESGLLFTIGHHKFYGFHGPHYALIRVRPALPNVGGPGGAPAQPQPDVSKPLVTVVLLRDLGSLRFPPFVVAVTSFIVFGILCYWLHERDKQLMATRAAAATA